MMNIFLFFSFLPAKNIFVKEKGKKESKWKGGCMRKPKGNGIKSGMQCSGFMP